MTKSNKQKPADEQPAAATETPAATTEQPAATDNTPAGDPPAAAAPPAPPAPPSVKTVAEFARDFLGKLPLEAAGGSYGATVRDRWQGKEFKIADGSHAASGWTFTFRDGRFVKASKIRKPSAPASKA